MLQGTRQEIWVGITCGFTIGFFALNGVESLIEKISHLKFHMPGSGNKEYIDISSNGFELPKNQFKRTKVLTETGEELDEVQNDNNNSYVANVDMWEEEGLTHAASVFAIPEHRRHINEHIQELIELIQSMETKSNRLLEDDKMTVDMTETIAEDIDESVHILQYKLDHCRRLLQGSEVGERTRPTWVTEDKKLAMKKRLIALRYTALHLVDHMKEAEVQGWVDSNLLHEIYEHMRDMDGHISRFHEYADTWTWKWQRRPELTEPELGDTLPLSLIIPVTIDCFVDGFLIGISVALSRNAGYVLAAANCLEMSSLGMAYSSRLAKCTGSSAFARQAALLLPPLLMFLSSGFGAYIADLSTGNPMLFITFVSFGIFALISLVCCELIMEAREVQDSKELWWLQLFIFFGVYVVIMVETAL
jgi:zinc transporter ZupT